MFTQTFNTMNNRITKMPSGQELSQILQKLSEIRTMLAPYLQSLTVTERHDLPKMSNKSYSFVAKAAEYSESNPQFVPAFTPQGELNRDFYVVEVLRPILDSCAQLHSDLDDTLMLAGSEAYTESLMYYNNVKLAASRGEASAKPIHEDLAARFPGRKRVVNPNDAPNEV